MDLQQALTTPHTSTFVVLYMRQLWTYNFGVHLCDDHSAVMCVWPEHVASRVADEVGSRLLKAIPTMRRVKRMLIVWSESCSGQKKNLQDSVLVVGESGMLDEVVHIFFVPGHRSRLRSNREA